MASMIFCENIIDGKIKSNNLFYLLYLYLNNIADNFCVSPLIKNNLKYYYYLED